MGSSPLFFNYLPYIHCLIIRQPHKINPTGQIADIYLCFGVDDLAGNDLLTLNIHY